MSKKTNILNRVNKIFIFVFLLFSFIIFICYIKGQVNLNNTYKLKFQKDYNTSVGGPFEVSNSTSRYALTESIVKDHAFILNKTLARFSAPDVAYYHDKFISLFTPGVSFLSIPFYIIGSHFGIPQLITFLLNPIIAIFNIFLIALILKRLKFSFLTGIFSGMVFIFATDALSYSFTFTQHDLTVFLVLLGIINLFGTRTWLKNLYIGALLGAATLVDIPNVLFFTPILLAAAYQHITIVKSKIAPDKLIFSIKISIIGIIIGSIPFFTLFAWYNFTTSGSYIKLAQFIGRTNYFANSNTSIQNQVVPEAPTVKVAPGTPHAIGLHLPFQSRLELNGLYTLLLSNERSWIYYSPIVFMGLIGIYILYKKKDTRNFSILIITIVSIDILIYSIFGDPWGGWAFGPRYLIPAAALLCIGIGPFIERYKKNYIIMPIFFGVLLYSIWVNNMGALTTTAIPPRVEAQNLSTHLPYTYKYNEQLINQNQTNSFIYNFYFVHRLSLQEFLWILVALSFGIFVLLYILVLLDQKGDKIK